MADVPTYLPGIAEPLPPGESVRWQGSADPRAVARHVFHQRTAAWYLGAVVVLVGVRAAMALPPADALRVTLLPLVVSALLLGAVEVMARATARNAHFAITDRRVVVQVGAAFPIAINIPLRTIQSAGLRQFRDGSGEIRLVLGRDLRVAWAALWPFVHPLHINHPEPLLRGLRDPQGASDALRDAAVADAARQEGTALSLGPAPAAVARPLTVSLAP